MAHLPFRTALFVGLIVTVLAAGALLLGFAVPVTAAAVFVAVEAAVVVH